MMEHEFIICIFYTREYAGEAFLLKKNAEKMGYHVYLEKYFSRKIWELNVAIKPKFIWKCLNKFMTKDILYLDVDCSVMKKLEYFTNRQDLFDISIFFTGDYPSEYWSDIVLTGTIFFKNNENVRKFVLKWKNIQSKQLFDWDQKTFALAMREYSGLKFDHLPLEYVKIFDIEKHGLESRDPFIVHNMASRTLRQRGLTGKLPVDFNSKGALYKTLIIVNKYILSLAFDLQNFLRRKRASVWKR